MRFADLKGIDGIDKLNDCVPYVEEIFSDKELFESIKNMTWVQAATPIYKQHKESIEKIMEILEEEPQNSAETIVATTNIISGIRGDKDTLAFFTASCESLRSMLLPMVNTEGEQSKDS